MNEARSRFSIASDFPLVNSRGLASSVKGRPEPPIYLLGYSAAGLSLARHPAVVLTHRPFLPRPTETLTLRFKTRVCTPFAWQHQGQCHLESREFLTVVMIQPGLERISLLLKHTPLPWKAIHVAGTNGKGSICAAASAMLLQSKVRCGRFTSPHLIDRYSLTCIFSAAFPLYD